MSSSRCSRLRSKLADALQRDDIRDLEVREWYEAVGIKESDTRLMLRSMCKYTRHYPKVKPRDVWTNNFEPNIHSIYVQANMDIQALLSIELTLRYLIKYVLKGEPSREAEARSDRSLASTSNDQTEVLSLKVTTIYLSLYMIYLFITIYDLSFVATL